MRNVVKSKGVLSAYDMNTTTVLSVKQAALQHIVVVVNGCMASYQMRKS